MSTNFYYVDLQPAACRPLSRYLHTYLQKSFKVFWSTELYCVTRPFLPNCVVSTARCTCCYPSVINRRLRDNCSLPRERTVTEWDGGFLLLGQTVSSWYLSYCLMNMTKESINISNADLHIAPWAIIIERRYGFPRTVQHCTPFQYMIGLGPKYRYTTPYLLINHMNIFYCSRSKCLFLAESDIENAVPLSCFEGENFAQPASPFQDMSAW